ncbi:MAG: hypothetical protein ACLUSP_02970 [Christensenellales bacterium]
MRCNRIHRRNAFSRSLYGRGVTAYKIVEKPQDAGYPRIALLTLERESLLNAVIDEVYENKPELIVVASYDLTETGRVQAREGVTPVQLLHREGILDKCAVVGGNYLDRDDVELMQSAERRLSCA